MRAWVSLLHPAGSVDWMAPSSCQKVMSFLTFLKTEVVVVWVVAVVLEAEGALAHFQKFWSPYFLQQINIMYQMYKVK